MSESVAPEVAAVIVLAAGEGKRMNSRTPKVLHEIGGRSLLGHVLAAAGALAPRRLLVVVGHGRDAVVAHLAQIAPEATPVVQERQDGTGHAVRLALDALVAGGGDDALAGTIIVCSADASLLTGDSLVDLARKRPGVAAVVLTAQVPDPTGYGRVLRDASGGVRAIVEHADATDAERVVAEINTSVYAFDGQALREALAGVSRDNVQGEEYLTDVVGAFVESGAPVIAVRLADWREGEGVNDRVQLAAAGRRLRDRTLEAWMRAGVTVVDPATTWVDGGVELEPDAVLLPNTHLSGATRVAAGARVGPNVALHDTTVGPGATVADATCDGARIGEGAQVGPYTYLRPGTVLGRGAKAGGFVEMKNAQIGDESKVPHLSYVGDATVGERTNVGAATVFVNYDGVAKHRTVVGDDVRIGSDTMLVAPLEVGDGAYTAAGSVITEDVPPGALAVGRSRQRNIEGWVKRKRAGTPAARAAEQSHGHEQAEDEQR